MTRVLTAGETMALLDPVEDGALDLGDLLRLRIAGAESNFAVGMARLGVPVAWVSRVGADRLGALVTSALSGEGVDLRWVVVDSGVPTGLFYKWREDGQTSVAYYRRGSAASRLAPGDVPDEALEGVDLVHLTGITMALGEGPRALVASLARRARAAGATVVFDPNYRAALWDGPEEAAAAMAPVLGDVDWYLCGLEEAEKLLRVRGAEAVVEALPVSGVVVRVGVRGAVVAAGGSLSEVPPARVEDVVVDEIGAGDAYAAGFAYGLVQGWEPERCAHAGNVVAAFALRGTGDWETLPTLSDVRELL